MAATVFLIVLMLIVAVDVWAAIAVSFGSGLSARLCLSYFLILLLAVVATMLMTGVYSYYPNPNTHIFGWPVPCVIFQRDTPTSPWLDYVGFTVVLAYPMNFVLFMFIPSVAVIVLKLRRRRLEHKT
jgi:hypothetical protein